MVPKCQLYQELLKFLPQIFSSTDFGIILSSLLRSHWVGLVQIHSSKTNTRLTSSIEQISQLKLLNRPVIKNTVWIALQESCSLVASDIEKQPEKN